MKKIWMLFLLCLTLLCAACGNSSEDTTPTPTPSPIATPSPSPAPTPANAAIETLDNLEAAWESLLNWNGIGNMDVTNGFGYDVTMDISVNQMLMSLLGMADLSNLGIDMTMDMNNELLAADMTLNLNKDELLNMVMFFDYEKLLYNFPKYSSQYAGIETETESGSTVAIPDTEELLSMYKNIVADLFGTFKAQEGFIDNATIEREGYKVTGQKFTVSASVADINTVLNDFASVLLDMYPDAEVEITEIPEDEMTALIFNVYKGSDGTFAWEIYPDTSADEPIGLISAENGFCLFTTTDGTTEILLRSEKSSSLDGTVFFQNEGEELILNYTLSDNAISVSDAEDTIAVSVGWQFSDEYISLDFSLLTEEIGLVCSMVADGKKAHMDMALSSYGTELVKLSADYTIRDCNQVTMPESYIDEKAWEAQMDTDAFLADIEALIEKYPMLESLLGEIEDSDDDYSDDDGYGDSEYDPNLTYENEFTNMTGYYVDDYGDVYFEALESEVLALGVPSTGFYYTEITADQRQALIDYATTVFADDYEQSGTFYYITGNVADSSVVSRYFTEYYIVDNSNPYNIVDLYFEAVTGYFYSIDLYRPGKAEAFVMANEVLALLGETAVLNNNLDAATLEEGVMIGNYLIYGYDYGDYYCISIY